MAETVKIGISELAVVKSPLLIRTSGLGSCVGIVVYDSQKKMAAMAHVMLPDSTLARTESPSSAKYADTAVRELVRLLIQGGAHLESLHAKMAGGAQMFHFSSDHEMMRIGQRNVEAVKKELDVHNIPLVSEDTGGNKARTIEFSPDTFKLRIKTVKQGEVMI